MRFLIDTTCLRSSPPSKFTRVLKRLLAESGPFETAAVEISSDGQVMPADERSGELEAPSWRTIPARRPSRLDESARAAMLLACYFGGGLTKRFLPERQWPGLAWHLAYSFEIFSPAWRERFVRFLELDRDADLLGSFHYWLNERGSEICDTAPCGAYDLSREISIKNGDVLVLAGASWRHDLGALERLKSAYGLKLACVVYDLLPIDYPSFVTTRQHDQYKQFLHDAGRAADVIVTPNAAAAERLRSFLAENGVRRDGVSFISFHAAALAKESAAPSQRLLDLQSQGGFMLCVSPLRERKHILWLYAICAKLHRERPDFPRLVLAGGAANPRILAVLSRDPGWGAAGLFIDAPLDAELCWLYKNARLFLYPSFEGGLGLTLTEAVNCGLPSIAGDAPSLVEASQGRALHLPRDETLWADAILNASRSGDGARRAQASNAAMRPSPGLLEQLSPLLEAAPQRSARVWPASAPAR